MDVNVRRPRRHYYGCCKKNSSTRITAETESLVADTDSAHTRDNTHKLTFAIFNTCWIIVGVFCLKIVKYDQKD